MFFKLLFFFQVLNTFFSNIVGSLNIPEYVTNDPISENISDPVIKLIVKYRKHPSILTIGEVCKERKKEHAAFLISQVAKEEIFRDIFNIDVSKACQDTDIPSKIIKENADSFASLLHSSFNTSVTNSEFPSVLKQANITPVFKKGRDILMITIDQLVSCLMCLRYLNDACFAK